MPAETYRNSVREAIFGPQVAAASKLHTLEAVLPFQLTRQKHHLKEQEIRGNTW
jgi:hypothetical protein